MAPSSTQYRWRQYRGGARSYLCRHCSTRTSQGEYPSHSLGFSDGLDTFIVSRSLRIRDTFSTNCGTTVVPCFDGVGSLLFVDRSPLAVTIRRREKWRPFGAKFVCTVADRYESERTFCATLTRIHCYLYHLIVFLRDSVRDTHLDGFPVPIF